MPNAAETGWTARRRHMVETQLVPRGIEDSRVLAAMRDLPREQFVEGDARLRCYRDEPVGIGHRQTLSQPY
ncbi:MAG: protein-L-isoaspartate(D-aspartate) O-methyltransferase, partial [Bryobacteraceae bacterium]